MSDEEINISDSEEARASEARLIKAIEGWAVKESQKSEPEVIAFGAALSSGLIRFQEFTSRDCRNSQQLLGAISRAKQHIDREFRKFDGEIDKMHIKFAQEMEELDLKIIRDRKEFKHYLISLIYAEEYNKLRNQVNNIYETLDAKARYETNTEGSE